MTLLFIDDDIEDLILFSEAVKSLCENHDITMAANGEAGMSILEHLVPDLVFLDINMPKLDGKTVLKRIRQNHTLNLVKVCMFSTSISPIECQFYKKLGADYCLQKPSSFEALKRSLQSLINPSTASQACQKENLN